MPEEDFRHELAQQLRVDSVRASDAAGSGHPTSSMSAADLMAVLLDGYLHRDYQNPGNPHNDHLIFSKGHASPLYYAMLKAVGVIDNEELLTFRRHLSRLEGHPTPRIPPTPVATGSLGQGLPIGVGLALTGQALDRLPYRIWVLCGDSEMAEGSIWEAVEHASWYGLDNLTAIVDVNRLGQTRETMLGWDLDRYAARFDSFGWEAIPIDGHSLTAIDDGFHRAVDTRGRPTVILARTRKGRGVRAVEDQEGAHGKPLPDPAAAVKELGGERHLTVHVAAPQRGARAHGFPTDESAAMPRWEVGDEEATRSAYGKALAVLGSHRADVVCLDGEVSNSTHSDIFAQAHPDRYFEMFIAEQQMIAAAIGMQARGWTPFVSTFGAFLSRAYDFLRMATVSRAHLCVCGSHAGVSIGQDGPSQMALEDIASFRALHGSTVLHPSDANQTARLVAEIADRPGVNYLRTLRGKTRVRTPPEEHVQIGGSRTVRSSDHDDVTIICCGVTVDEAAEAAEGLHADGITARVLDCYSVQPIDDAAIRAAASQTRGLLTVEDHRPAGGLGEAVLEALAQTRPLPPVRILAVRNMPISGTPAELMADAGIDATAIRSAVHELLAKG